MTQHDIYIALAEENLTQLAREDTVLVHTHISALLMITEGLDIKSQQYVCLLSPHDSVTHLIKTELDSNQIVVCWMPPPLLFN